MKNPLGTGECAFTRIELLAISVALLLIAIVVAPALASNKSDSERMICFNNLRLVGRGVQIWAADHNQQFPWRTPVAEGGEFTGGSRPGNAWFEYLWMSNELVTPKILPCPSDVGVLQAKGWYEFVSAPFRANALSYPLNMDGSMDAPQTWLSGDRNIRSNPGGGCSTGVNNVYEIPSNGSLAWTNGAVHGPYGHVLTTGGSVEFTSTKRLKELLVRPEVDDDGSTHFLRAR